MAENRYNPFVSDQQLKQNKSLLLSPPSSGFSFGPDEGNSILLPVGHGGDSLATVDVETDSFIGQAPQQQDDLQPFTMFQQQHTLPTGNINDPFATFGGNIPVAEVPPNPQTIASPVLPLMEQTSVYKPHVSPEDIQNKMFPADTSFRRLSGSGDLPDNFPSPIQTSRRASSDSNVPEKFIPPPDLRRQSSVGLPSYPLQYDPVHPHWFYKKEIEKRLLWIPFSLLDSMHLEERFNSGNHEIEEIVPTNGGRYDVHLSKRVRYSIYWDESPAEVRRCTWFYKGEGEKRYVPYEEHFGLKLEDEFRNAITTNTWHRRLEFPGGETIIIHNPNVVVHFQASTSTLDWENVPHEAQLRPRVVKRGIEDFDNIEDGESPQIDHLVFVVHGIGGFCDLKFRTVTEVVDDFRSISNSLLQSHFKQHVESGNAGRIEFLPIAWHSTLHGDATGIDTRLQPITLNSIPKLRYFANDTILDVLFYTSPVYCQTILNQVGSEINRIHHQFLERNPTFKGDVSLIGHSLGSVILFDLLLHQRRLSADPGDDDFNEPEDTSEEGAKPESNSENIDVLSTVLKDLSLEEYIETFEKEKIDAASLLLCSDNDLKELNIPLGPRKKFLEYTRKKNEENLKKANRESTKRSRAKPSLVRRKSLSTVNYMVGYAGTGQPFVSYPRLDFQPSCFFALGSPIAMFLTVRGLHTIQNNFELPTCPAFFNIFHPFDPVAYRMETLIEPSFTLKPLLIPHHKGRKRMHLEIKESLTRVGSDLKQLFFDSLKSTWNSINDFARAHKAITAQVEAEMEKIAEEEDEETENDQSDTIPQETPEEQTPIGKLNRGRRFDYVLQEKPIESFNEYLFALQSHMCYWESEDTVLLVLKEIYSLKGIRPNVVMAPRPLEFWNLPVPSKTPSTSAQNLTQTPTVPPPPTAVVAPQQHQVTNISVNGPPPLAGFVRQSIRK